MAKLRLKRITAAVVCAAVVLSVCLFAPGGAQAAGDKTDELIAYIADNVKKGVAEIDVASFRFDYTAALKDVVANSVYYELPELFCVERLSFLYTDILETVTVTYNCGTDEYKTMLAECVSEADRLLNGIEGNASLGDAEKALLIHDRLALLCEYDPSGVGDGEPGPRARDMYGALVNHTAVCDGYTRAYLYLLDRVGIPCGYCRSDKLNHSWNIVTVGGKAYHVDVTYDDLYPDISGRVNHDNFLLSTAAFRARDHAADDYTSLPADTAYDNAFWRYSHTAFVLAGGSLYYIDSDKGTLNRYSDRKALASLGGSWGAYRGCYARLATDGSDLFYSTNSGVYRYLLATGKTERVFAPSLPKGYSVYGFVLRDGEILCELNDSPVFSAATKQNHTRRTVYAPHRHSFTETLTEPDCEHDGYRVYTCACGYSYSEVTAPSAGHTRVTDPGVSPSCVGYGLSEGCHCAVCGKTIVSPAPVPPLGHSLAVTVVVPGCTAPGRIISRCTRCGYSSAQPAATPCHAGGQPYLDADGNTVRDCAICGAAVASPDAAVPFIRCDVDGDGLITEADARCALQAALGLSEASPNSREFLAADMNGDGVLTAADARAILLFAAPSAQS